MKHTKDLIILQIIPQLKQGGIERGVLDIFRYLNQKKIKNYIFCENFDSEFLSNGEKKNIFTSNNIKFKSLKNYFKLNKLLLEIIEKKNINIVHISSRAPAFIFNKIIKRNKSIKYITGFHNPYMGSFLKKIYNSFLLKGDLIICNSNFTKQYILKNFDIDDNNIKSIPRGTDLKYFDPSIFGQKLILRKKKVINITAEDVVLTIPSRFSRWKGHYELISFLNILPEPLLNSLKLILIVDNQHFDKQKILKKCNKILKKNIRFIKPTNNIREIYAISDIIVSCSSKPEGFGRTISESLAMNKIPIGVNNGGVREQLIGFDNKLLFEPNDIDSFSKSLYYALSLLKNKKFDGRSYIQKNYSLSIMLKSTLEVYLSYENR